jgi:NAD(P)-dependent dehydrogenase (short-subunit alcohol dehydrogenase family)
MKLAGKVAIITGAGRGLGRASAIAMAKEGAAVVIVSRTLPDLEETAATIRAAGADVLACRADVSNTQAVEGVVARTMERFGKIDILMNNAAIVGPLEPLFKVHTQAWNEVLATNLTGALLFSNAVLVHMIKRKSGKIINVTSGLGEIVMSPFGPYSITKAGLIHLTRIMAAEMKVYNIQINGLDPGEIDTRMQAEVRALGPEKLGDEVYDLCSGMKERGELKPPEAVVGLVVFLASEASDSFSGANGTAAYYRRFGYTGSLDIG